MQRVFGFMACTAWRPVRQALLCALMLMPAVGCEVNSYFDPSRTGRFMETATTMPVLERIDAIEPSADLWGQTRDRPTPRPARAPSATVRLCTVARLDVVRLACVCVTFNVVSCVPPCQSVEKALIFSLTWTWTWMALPYRYVTVGYRSAR